MVKYCCAYNCNNTDDKGGKSVKFHRFPLKDRDRLKAWLYVIKRENFTPTRNTVICSAHFKASNYVKSLMNENLILKKDAVPSIFNHPTAHEASASSAPAKRRIIKQTAQEDSYAMNIDTNVALEDKPSKYIDAACQTDLSSAKLQETLDSLRREKKCLQQQLNRRNRRVSNMKDILSLSRENKLVESEDLEDVLRNNFEDSIPVMLFKNEIENKKHSSTNKRYTEDVKKFCLTLYFYSPRAYEFLREKSSLPRISTIRRWLASSNCNPGILKEVLAYPLSPC